MECFLQGLRWDAFKRFTMMPSRPHFLLSHLCSLSWGLILRQAPLTVARWCPRVPELHARPVTPEHEREFLFSITAQKSLVLLESCTHSQAITLGTGKAFALMDQAWRLNPLPCELRVKSGGPWGKARHLQEGNGQWTGRTVDAHYPRLAPRSFCFALWLDACVHICPQMEPLRTRTICYPRIPETQDNPRMYYKLHKCFLAWIDSLN